MAALERRRSLGLGRRGVAGDERQPGDPAVETVPAEDPPDAVRADPDAAPPVLGQGGADPPRAEARGTEAEGDDPVLGELARLVRHPGRPALPRPEHLEARPEDRSPPAGLTRSGGDYRGYIIPGRLDHRFRRSTSAVHDFEDPVGSLIS
jgi:hypothetical protein